MLKLSEKALVQEAYKLHQNLSEKLHPKGKNEENITNLFLLKTGAGLRFEAKNSFRATIISVTDNLLTLFGKKSSFDIATNIQECAAMINEIAKIDSDTFKAIAHTIEDPKHEGKSLSGKALQKAIQELAENLKTLCLHVETQGALNPKRVSDKSKEPFFLTKKIAESFQSVQAKKEAQPLDLPPEESIGEFFKKIYGKELSDRDYTIEHIVPGHTFNTSLVKEINTFLGSQKANTRLFKMLFAGDLSQEQKLSAIQYALWRELSLTTDTEIVTKYKSLIGSLAPPKPEKVPVNLKEIGIVFGDSFIKDSSIEGYLSQHFVDIVSEFLQQSPKKTPAKEEILSMCQNRIDLSAVLPPHDTCEKVKAQLQSPPHRCLLVGGWYEHAINYEIEKKGDSYCFRVFNEGDGIQYHTQYSPQYRRKISPCISVEDISETYLFQDNFFGCLQALISMNEIGSTEGKLTAADILSTHLLPMLHGKAAALPPHVQTTVSPQRSGTCTYKSFKAFLAHSLSKEEYKQFVFDFEKFMLRQYKTSLSHTLKSNLTEESYHSERECYAVIKRSIERFAQQVERMELLVSPLEIEEARAQIIEYTLLLKELDAKIVNFEKISFRNSITSISCSDPMDFSPPSKDSQPSVFLTAYSSLMTSAYIHTIDLVEAIKDPSDPAFSASVESALTVVYEMTSQTNSYVLSEKKDLYKVYEALFRKMGHLDAWKNVSFSNPSQAMNQLSAIARFVFANIENVSKKELFAFYEGQRNFISNEHYILFLAASRGVELVCKKCEKEKCFLKDDSPSLISQSLLPHLQKLQFSDPFWASMTREIQNIAQKTSSEYFPVSSKKDEIFTMSQPLASLIWQFWERPEQALTREQVQKSIDEDRKTQEQLIISKTARLKAAIASQEKNIQLLKTQHADKDTIKQAQGDLYQLQAQLSALRTKIEDPPKYGSIEYWPKGFEKSESVGGKSHLQYKAPFLFIQKDFLETKSIQDPFPQEFRSFYYLCLATPRLFKKHGAISIEGDEGLPSVSDASQDSLKLCPFALGCSDKFINPPDQYKENLAKQSGIRMLYTKLREEKPKNEPDVPHYISGIFGKTLPQDIGVDEAVELASIACDQKIQVDSITDFFQEHRDALRDPGFINMFHSLLFESDFLLSSFEDDATRPFFIDKIRSFVTSAIENALKAEDVITATNMLWIASSVEKYANHVSKNRVGKDLFPFTIDPPLLDKNLLIRTFETLMKPEYTPQQPVALEAIVACMREYLKNIPKNEHDQKLFVYGCIASCLSSEKRIEKKEDKCTPRYEDAQNTLFSLRLCVSKAHEEHRSDKINALLDTHCPEILKNIFPAVKSFSFIHRDPDTHDIVGDGEPQGTFCLSTSQLIRGQEKGLVYTLPLSNEERRCITSIGFTNEDCKKMRSCRRVGTSFISYPNKEVEIKMPIPCYSALDILIKTKLITTWARYNGQLLSQYPSFTTPETKYLCVPPTYSIAYTIASNEKIALAHGRIPPLHIANSPKPNPFGSFESPEQTIFLANDENELQEIQFPRLSITLQKNNGKWNFAEQNGWYLAQEQFVPHFGQSTGFLVFENDQGQKKVLFPTWDPISSETKESLSFPYSYDFQENHVTKGRYVECDIQESRLYPNNLKNREFSEREHHRFDSEKSVPLSDIGADFSESKMRCSMKEKTDSSSYLGMIPKTYEARLCLARIYLEKGFIDEAEKLLYSHDALMSSRPLSQEESKILQSIYESLPPKEEDELPEKTSGEISPRVMKLRLHALYLAEKNNSLFKKDPEKKSPEEMKDTLLERIRLYREYYLSRLHAVDPLDRDEEYFLVKKIEEYGIDTASLFPREKVLARKDKIRPIVLMLEQRKDELKSGSLLLTEEMWQPTTLPPQVKKFPIELPEEQLKELWNTKMRANVLFNEEEGYPFDLKEVTAEELEPYIPHLRNMLSSENKSKQAKATSTLYFMALCARNSEVSDMARFVINEKQQSVQKMAERTLVTKEKTPIKALQKKEPHFPTPKDLPALQCTKASFEHASFLAQRRALYFEEKAAAKILAPSSLFDASSPEICDETTKKKFQQAEKDLNAAGEKVSNTTFTLKDGKQIENLHAELTAQYNEESIKLTSLENDIIKIVHTALTEDPISYSQFISKKRELPSIDELCVLCAKKDSQKCFKTLYPEFSKEGIEALQKSTQQYLIQKQFCQSLKRSKTLTQNILTSQQKKAAPEIIKSLMNTLASSLFSANFYGDDDPNIFVYLLVETISDIRLRKDQVDNLSLFIKKIHEKKNISLQMIMGAGKTSVLQPILAFIYADPNSFSVVDVPEANFPAVRSSLSKLLGSAFSQYVFSMDYERKMIKEDATYLDDFYRTLKETQAKEGCFLRTHKVKQSMLTSLYEAYADCASPNATHEDFARLEKISKICDFCEKYECAQIDEVQHTLNPKVLFKYPIGSATTVDSNRAEILSELLVDIAFDTELTSHVSFDFADALQKRLQGDSYKRQGSSLTKEFFQEQLQTTLAEKAFSLLSLKIPQLKELSESQNILLHFLQQKTPFDKDIHLSKKEETVRLQELLKDFKTIDALKKKRTPPHVDPLLEKLIYKKESEAWIKENITNIQERELIGVCAEAISTIFEVSLFKECGSHYGVDTISGSYTARPYAAPKSPKKTIYKSPYEQVIYTTQLILHTGIPKKAARAMIIQLQAHIQESSSRGVLFKDIPEYTQLQRLLGESPTNFRFLENPPSDTFINAFAESVSKDKESIMDFLRGFTYRQIRLFFKDITSTPQALAGSTKQTITYTGTLPEGILPKNMEAYPELGTNGRTILAVEDKMTQKASSISVLDSRKEPVLDTVSKSLTESGGPLVFIDSGGWLKTENIRDYAKKLLTANRPGIKGIVYLKETGSQEEIDAPVCLQKNERGILEEIPLDDIEGSTTDGRYLTIITQKHEIATNILQPPLTKALVSIRKGMNASDLLQSVFRMRGILEEQSASFLITDEVREDIASNIWKGLVLHPPFQEALRTKDTFLAHLKTAELPQHVKNQLEKYCKQAANIEKLKETFIKQFEPDSASIWRYVTTNEALDEQSKNWIAAQQRMREVVEKPIRMALENHHLHLGDRQKLFAAIQSICVSDDLDSPFAKMTSIGALQEANEAIESQVQYFLSFIKKIEALKGNSAAELALHLIRTQFPECKDTTSQAVEKALRSCVKKEDIAAVVQSKISADQELEVEVETEVEQEQEQEVETEAMYDALKQKNLFSIFSLQNNAICIPRSSPHLLSVNHLKTKSRCSFSLPKSHPISYSSNLILEKTSPDTDYHLPGRYLLAVHNRDTQKLQFVLLGVNDASFIKEHNARSLPPQELVLMTLSGDVVVSSSPEAPSHIEHKSLVLARIQGKLCTGSVHFSPEELISLKECLQGYKQEAKNLKTFFEDILRLLPTASKHYIGSELRKVLCACAGEPIPKVVRKLKTESVSPQQKNLLTRIRRVVHGMLFFWKKPQVATQITKKKITIEELLAKDPGPSIITRIYRLTQPVFKFFYILLSKLKRD